MSEVDSIRQRGCDGEHHRAGPALTWLSQVGSVSDDFFNHVRRGTMSAATMPRIAITDNIRLAEKPARPEWRQSLISVFSDAARKKPRRT
jgi:hypothetical protein